LLYKEPAEPVKPQSEIRKKRFYIPCPECGELMNQKNYARISGVVIDVCKLHGIWFERHELRQIVNFIRTGGLSKAREAELANIQAEQSRLKAMQDSQSLVQRSLMSDPNERDFSDGRSLIDVLYSIARRFLR
jgi:Zn-finger nucleic acid-binding protein